MLQVNKLQATSFVQMANNQSETGWSPLSDEEKWRVENQTPQQEHQDHRSMSTMMILLLLVAVFVAQIILIHWRKRHFKSYQRATLLGMWLVPIGLSLKRYWWRFCIIWLVFSIITAFVTFKASRKPLLGSTPRWVYKWFLFLHKVSYAAGILGYVLVLLTLVGVNFLVMVETKTSVNFALSLLFYSFYFGVVSRDFAEVCADIMASHIGYYSATGLPARRLDSNTCAVCGSEIFMMSNDDVAIEKTSKLTCGHIFHEFCIRGWCIVGKKQTCPYCKEKVDLKRMFPSPWERPHVMYGRLLDCIRYFVAWHPIISVLVRVVMWLFGLD